MILAVLFFLPAAGGIIGAAYNDVGTPSTTRYRLYRGNVIDYGAGTNPPHPDPNRLLKPFIVGQEVIQDMINNQGLDQCKLASGSDPDWGFGGCPYTPWEWNLNSATEHITLRNIPNPGIQPK